MTRIAIAADLHVDDFGTKVDPATGLNARFVDGLQATRYIAEQSVALGAEALVVAGDYTEHKAPAPPRVARILEELRRGPARQIHVRGNHDSERAGRSIVDVLGQVEGWAGVTTSRIEMVEDVAVCVVPFVGKSYLRAQPGMESLDQDKFFQRAREIYLGEARKLFVDAQQLQPRSTILVGHQQLSGGRMSDTQMAFLGDMDLVVDARALQSIGYAAVVFGHVHRGQTVIDDPVCPVVFVGSAHRVDFAEEMEEKSFVLLDVEGGRVKVDRVVIPARRFVTVDAGAWPIEPEHGGPDSSILAGAVVRVLNVPVEDDIASIRRTLEALGAFDIQEIRRRPVSGTAVVGGLSEGLTPSEALVEYFADDVDREVLVERGRQILAEVAA